METFLALDPGEMTGWVLFNTHGVPMQMGEAHYSKGLKELLDTWRPDFYVVEQFRVRTKGNNNQKVRRVAEWDIAPAARAIGKIELRAEDFGRPVYFQEPSIMSRSAQLFGLPLNRKHKDNAILHGLWWLHQNRGLMPKDRPVEVIREPRRSTVVVPVQGLGGISKALKKLK